MIRVLLLLLLSVFVQAQTLRAQIAQLLIVGIGSDRLEEHGPLMRQLRATGLGGVVLFRKDIHGPKQLQRLSLKLHHASRTPLWIAVDQEGGAVQRLDRRNGFVATPSAQAITHLSYQEAYRRYRTMTQMLHREGIDLDFAPVVDLAINPQNGVIVKAGRSYGRDPARVVRYAEAMLRALESEGILGCVKHFPGHGSSRGDSHKGFTDISMSWKRVELEPFARLIRRKEVAMVMVGHLYQRGLDPNMPASLSYPVVHDLLRKRLGFEGIVVSDDMQMGAIRRCYRSDEAIARALEAGVDMLLFANQTDRPVTPRALIDTIERLVAQGRIKRATIERAYRRIMSYKKERDATKESR